MRCSDFKSKMRWIFLILCLIKSSWLEFSWGKTDTSFASVLNWKKISYSEFSNVKAMKLYSTHLQWLRAHLATSFLICHQKGRLYYFRKMTVRIFRFHFVITQIASLTVCTWHLTREKRLTLTLVALLGLPMFMNPHYLNTYWGPDMGEISRGG